MCRSQKIPLSVTQRFLPWPRSFPRCLTPAASGENMEIVIDTIDDDGLRRALVVEAIICDGIFLKVRRGDKITEIPISTIADWSPIDEQDPFALTLDRWMPRGRSIRRIS